MAFCSEFGVLRIVFPLNSVFREIDPERSTQLYALEGIRDIPRVFEYPLAWKSAMQIGYHISFFLWPPAFSPGFAQIFLDFQQNRAKKIVLLSFFPLILFSKYLRIISLWHCSSCWLVFQKMSGKNFRLWLKRTFWSIWSKWDWKLDGINNQKNDSSLRWNLHTFGF